MTNFLNTGRPLTVIICALMLAAPPAGALDFFGSTTAGGAQLFYGGEHACHMATRLGCGGCSVSCPVARIAVCQAGINIWRGKAWACMLASTCSCRKSMWSGR
jgi:hypothetical protein